MADISKIKASNGIEYDLKDATAREMADIKLSIVDGKLNVTFENESEEG